MAHANAFALSCRTAQNIASAHEFVAIKFKIVFTTWHAAQFHNADAVCVYEIRVNAILSGQTKRVSKKARTVADDDDVDRTKAWTMKKCAPNRVNECEKNRFASMDVETIMF